LWFYSAGDFPIKVAFDADTGLLEIGSRRGGVLPAAIVSVWRKGRLVNQETMNVPVAPRKEDWQ